jgi:hypothetical protein
MSVKFFAHGNNGLPLMGFELACSLAILGLIVRGVNHSVLGHVKLNATLILIYLSILESHWENTGVIYTVWKSRQCVRDHQNCMYSMLTAACTGHRNLQLKIKKSTETI